MCGWDSILPAPTHRRPHISPLSVKQFPIHDDQNYQIWMCALGEGRCTPKGEKETKIPPKKKFLLPWMDCLVPTWKWAPTDDTNNFLRPTNINLREKSTTNRKKDGEARGGGDTYTITNNKERTSGKWGLN